MPSKSYMILPGSSATLRLRSSGSSDASSSLIPFRANVSRSFSSALVIFYSRISQQRGGDKVSTR